MSKSLKLPNPHLDKLETDHLYHIGLSTDDDLEKLFSDVRFVCMGGTVQRMRAFAEYIKKLLGIDDDELRDLTGHGHRFSIFKVGPVLSISHGMGGPSIGILLHEIFKLVTYAKCRDVVMIRLGTSGGVGVPPGTVVVSTAALNDLLEEHHQFHILGKVVQRPCVLDAKLSADITEAGRQAFPQMPIVNGKTMCATGFYESQGRLNGAFCHYDEADKLEFLNKLHDLGVVNIEMEASVFAAMCAHAGFPAAVVCVTLLDRMVCDELSKDKEQLLSWQERPLEVIGAYIRKTLQRH